MQRLLMAAVGLQWTTCLYNMKGIYKVNRAACQYIVFRILAKNRYLAEVERFYIKKSFRLKRD
jgi:hypothetical protein